MIIVIIINLYPSTDQQALKNQPAHGSELVRESAEVFLLTMLNFFANFPTIAGCEQIISRGKTHTRTTARTRTRHAPPHAHAHESESSNVWSMSCCLAESLEEILGPSSSAVIKKAEQEEEDDGGLYFVYNSLALFSFEEFVDDNGTTLSTLACVRCVRVRCVRLHCCGCCRASGAHDCSRLHGQVRVGL
jgi:hypothetical protein